MKWVVIIVHVLILSAFYLIGDWIQRTFDLFIPGSIIGMLLLFLVLLTKKLPVSFIDRGSTFLLRQLPILFLPVTVGAIQFLNVFIGKGFLLIMITIISTILVLVTVGLLGQSLVRRKERRSA